MIDDLKIDSLDSVELVMFIEEVFDTEIPDADAEGFGSRREFVDWLWAHLANSRPNKRAIAVLKTVAKEEDRPELLVDVNGCWRREQIAAIVRHLLKDKDWR